MKTIPLSNGQFTIVDDDDYEWLSQWNWQCVNGYASRCVYFQKTKSGKQMSMHRIIMKTDHDSPKFHIDHINRDKLDNQRSNLRYATSSQNGANKAKRQGTRSQYKGVYPTQNRNWKVEIRCERKWHYIGVFPTEVAAAFAYDEHARKMFGEYAHLNFPSMLPHT